MRIFFECFKKARKKMGIISSRRYKLIGQLRLDSQKTASKEGSIIKVGVIAKKEDK